MGRSNVKQRRINFLVPISLSDRLNELVEESGMLMSTYFRSLIELMDFFRQAFGNASFMALYAKIQWLIQLSELVERYAKDGEITVLDEDGTPVKVFLPREYAVVELPGGD